MIHVENLHIALGSFTLRNVSFAVAPGRHAVLMGRSGAGKTTLLEAICGLRRPSRGRIVLGDHDVTGLKPGERNIGLVPQDTALFSTMSVYDHLAFGPAIRRWSRADIDRRVHQLAEVLGIAHLLHRLPQGLSGGEAQRVAIGRALSFHPAVLCLDEPFNALDEQTRAEMYELFRVIRQHEQVTTLHITHSAEEMHALADDVLLLRQGAVVCASPAQLASGEVAL